VTRLSQSGNALDDPKPLVVLASGAMQHVFVESIERSVQVYKIPAIFDHLLPWPPPSGTLRRNLAAAYLRWRRIQAFHRMLRVLSSTRIHGLEDLILPCSTHRSMALCLHLDDIMVRYRGPVLVQQRAEHFFDSARGLHRFEWAAIVTAQQRFWRQGFGLAYAAGILGPHGWAVLGESLRLGDTGSLTRSRSRARWAHRKEVLDATTQAGWLYKTPAGEGEPIRDYLAFVRRRLGLEQLDQLWGAARPAARKRRDRGAPRPT
jgi:hypothetical protein